jgi:ABC-2 type transport system ATP-binding protein
MSERNETEDVRTVRTERQPYGEWSVAPDTPEERNLGDHLDLDLASGLQDGSMKNSTNTSGLSGGSLTAGGGPLAIEAVGLTKSFGDVVALDGLDLVVGAGSVTALIGPNGSGKTTTVRVLSTLLAPDGGHATVFGHDVSNEPEAVRAAIGVTGQFSAVDRMLSGRQNLTLMADLNHLRRPEGRRRAADLLERFELADAADRPAVTYSGGMVRRLDLAMTMMGEPRIIFLDEPTTGLDPRARRVLWQIVRDLVADGVTVLLTTQYLDEADQFADRVTLIDRGKRITEGTPAELKERVPGARIRMSFSSIEPLTAAAAVLGDATREGQELALLLSTDGSAAELRQILDRLDSQRIPVEGVSAQPPDLDDVFFALTGNQPSPVGRTLEEVGR